MTIQTVYDLWRFDDWVFFYDFFTFLELTSIQQGCTRQFPTRIGDRLFRRGCRHTNSLSLNSKYVWFPYRNFTFKQNTGRPENGFILSRMLWSAEKFISVIVLSLKLNYVSNSLAGLPLSLRIVAKCEKFSWIAKIFWHRSQDLRKWIFAARNGTIATDFRHRLEPKAPNLSDFPCFTQFTGAVLSINGSSAQHSDRPQDKITALIRTSFAGNPNLSSIFRLLGRFASLVIIGWTENLCTQIDDVFDEASSVRRSVLAYEFRFGRGNGKQHR